MFHFFFNLAQTKRTKWRNPQFYDSSDRLHKFNALTLVETVTREEKAHIVKMFIDDEEHQILDHLCTHFFDFLIAESVISWVQTNDVIRELFADFSAFLQQSLACKAVELAGTMSAPMDTMLVQCFF